MGLLSGHLPSPLQVTTTHSNAVPELYSGDSLLQVTLQGTPSSLVGSVQGSTPVLQELNGANFKQPVPLTGHLLLYRAKAANASTLPAVIGEEEACPCHPQSLSYS